MKLVCREVRSLTISPQTLYSSRWLESAIYRYMSIRWLTVSANMLKFTNDKEILIIFLKYHDFRSKFPRPLYILIVILFLYGLIYFHLKIPQKKFIAHSLTRKEEGLSSAGYPRVDIDNKTNKTMQVKLCQFYPLT